MDHHHPPGSSSRDLVKGPIFVTFSGLKTWPPFGESKGHFEEADIKCTQKKKKEKKKTGHPEPQTLFLFPHWNSGEFHPRGTSINWAARGPMLVPSLDALIPDPKGGARAAIVINGELYITPINGLK